MNRSDMSRVRHQAARIAMPGTTRQATTTPLGTRAGAQSFRAAEMQRGAPTQRGAADPKDDEDDDGLPDRAEGDPKDKDKKEVETDTDDENDDGDDGDKPDDDQKNKKAKSLS